MSSSDWFFRCSSSFRQAIGSTFRRNARRPCVLVFRGLGAPSHRQRAAGSGCRVNRTVGDVVFAADQRLICLTKPCGAIAHGRDGRSRS